MEADQSTNEGASPPETSSNLNKACEACRASKLRCIVDDDAADAVCKRCLATGRTCIFKAPRVRQRRKIHVDTRIAHLERQLRSLRMQLHLAQHPSAASGTTSGNASSLRFEAPVAAASWPRKSAAVSDDLILNHVSSQDVTFDHPPPTIVMGTDGSDKDVVERNVLDRFEAERLIQVYLADFASQYPFVTLPFFTDADTLRRDRPATFLAVLAAASVISSPDLNTILNHELLALLARRVMLDGEHNLDLVQAMIIMTIWYAPMDKFESLRHYQFAHLAATIAMDLGLGVVSPDSEDDMDRQRTVLSIYLLCTGISVTTGRPKMLRFTTYMEQCVKRLTARPDLTVRDRWFLAWVDLQRITETAATTFFTTPFDISDPAKQYATTDFCLLLDMWKRRLGIELGGPLEIHYYYVRSIVLSVVLYGDHDMEDFRPPFRVKSLNAKTPPPTPLSPFYARTAMALVQNVHSALDAFLAFNTVALLASPVIYYIRTLHPFSILLMLDISCRRPNTELGKILDQETLRVGHYFQAFQQMLSVYETDMRRTPAKFGAIIRRMETWWLAQGSQSAQQQEDLRPFAQLQPSGADVESLGTSQSPPSPRQHSASTETYPDAQPFTAMPDGGGDKFSFPELDDIFNAEDNDALLQDNWVINFDHDPSTFLLPEIDWALFEEQEMANPIE